MCSSFWSMQILFPTVLLLLLILSSAQMVAAQPPVTSSTYSASLSTTAGVDLGNTQDGGSSGSDDKSRVNGLKAMSIVCTLSLSLILNLLVLKLPCLRQAGTKYKSIISTANAFSAGIFLVLSVAHLLPEAVDVFEDEKHSFHTFRPPYAMCVLGYLTMMCLQRGYFGFDEKNLIAAFAASSAASSDSDNTGEGDSMGERDHNQNSNNPGTVEQPSSSSSSTSTTAVVSTDSAPDQENSDDDGEESTPAVEVVSTSATSSQNNNEPITAVLSSRQVATKAPPLAPTPCITTSTTTIDGERNNDSNSKKKKKSITSHHIPLVILLIVFALHSFTEGMVLGLEKTDSGVLVVFLAIFLHQWAEDITFALRTGKSGTLSHCWRLVLTCIEAFSAPTGMAVGWILESVIDDLTGAYIIAFSAGTFIFISCTEIMPETLPSGQRNVPQFTAVCLGGALFFFVMALLEAYL